MSDGRPALSMQAAAASAIVGGSHARSVEPQAAVASSLKIMHILRAPLGGLFRHVLDIASGQAARGHRVGLIVDSMTGGARADAVLAELEPQLALGLQRVAIARELGPSDFHALSAIAGALSVPRPTCFTATAPRARRWRGLRQLRRRDPRLHAPWRLIGLSPRHHRRRLLSLAGMAFEVAHRSFPVREPLRRRPVPRADRPTPALTRVVHNGVADGEFALIAPAADATDLVGLGELRPVKAFDVLITAVAKLKAHGRRVTATIAGEGPLEADLKAQAQHLQVADQVRFVGHRPARTAFAMGRTMVIPSRAESLPYVVLEAAAAGVPMIATRVGGIPEIFGPDDVHLIPSDDVDALAGAIGDALDTPEHARQIAQAVRNRVRSEFSLAAMVDDGLAAYREALTMRKLKQFA